MIAGLVARRPSAVTHQFVRFALVGSFGFIVDAGVLYLAMLAPGVGPYLGRLVSYLVAATTTWLLNRRFTFPHGRRHRADRQWARFVAANAMGGAVNYATYAVLIALGDPFASYPVLAVAVGSIAGLMLNFTASRSLVFR